MLEPEYLKAEQKKATELKERINFLKKIKGLRVNFYQRNRGPNDALYDPTKFILEIFKNDTWYSLEQTINRFETSNLISYTQIAEVVDKIVPAT